MFRLGKKRIYFDHAASTPASKGALRAFHAALALYGNPSSLHAEGVQARQVLEDARERVARSVGVRASGITFTSGATEANNLAIRGTIDKMLFDGRRPQDIHVLYHDGAHASVVESAESLRLLGVDVEPLTLIAGEPDIEAVRAQLKQTTALVIMEVVSGEIGMIFSVRDMRRLLDQHQKATGTRVLLHADASQAPRVHSILMTSLGADTLALDAQKIGGVRGIGVLARTHRVELLPIMHGGSQEAGLRPGTEHPALASACAYALEASERERAECIVHSQSLRDRCVRALERVHDVQIHTARRQAPHIINVSFKGRDTDYLLFLLDAQGYAVSTKSACESNAEGSRMVERITGDRTLAASTLRISFCHTTTAREVASLLTAIKENVRFLDKNAIE